MLLAYPDCVYTTSRTVSLTKILELETHIKRVSQSARIMLGDQARDFPKLTQPEELKERIMPVLRLTVSLFRSQNGEQAKSCELKVVLLADWKDAERKGGFFLICHASPLLEPPSGPITIEVRGHTRHHAIVKDSSWIREAKHDVELKLPSTNEIILRSPDGELLEGNSSNFFAVMNGVVWTAGEGIIEGTLRKMLLEACKDEGIPVKLVPPKISDLPKFEAALISSTSRLVLPVNKIILPKPGLPITSSDPTYDYGHNEIANKLTNLVAMRLESHSVEVMNHVDNCAT